jgi:hypothetical protein
LDRHLAAAHAHLRGFLFQIKATDALTLAALAAVLDFVAMLAGYFALPVVVLRASSRESR